MCHCGAVAKELVARADKPAGSTPGNAVFWLANLKLFVGC